MVPEPGSGGKPYSKIGATMTREQIAATVAARALQRAGASPDLTLRLALAHDRSNQRLSVVVPAYERTGKASIVYWLNHAVKGMDVSADDLNAVATWNDLVAAVVRRLSASPLLFRCTDGYEVHFYAEWDTGTCRIDGTPLEQIT